MLNLRNTAALGNVLFMPASLATLVSGLAMAWFWVGFSDLWVVIGLAGAAATFLTGVLLIKAAAAWMFLIPRSRDRVAAA
jgi:hypothetical protein